MNSPGSRVVRGSRLPFPAQYLCVSTPRNDDSKHGLAMVYRASISDLADEFNSVSWNNRDIPLLEYAKLLFQNKRTLVDSGCGRLTVITHFRR